MEDYQSRVIDERKELQLRIEKLEEFRKGNLYSKIDKAERDRMTAQLYFMKGYEAMLIARIGSFK